MVPLGDVVEVKGGGTPSKANSACWNGDIPWVSPKDMKCWDIEDAEDKITADAIKGSATNLIPRNSILIVNRSGILFHYLSNGYVRDVYLNPYITQSTISGINQSNLGKVRVLVPSLSRQDEFVGLVDRIAEKQSFM